MGRLSIAELKEDIVFSVTLRDRPFVFHTTWGLFSPEKIDDGSYLLIKNTEVRPDDRILDLGCGYGAIGLALAPETNEQVHFVDKDFVALEYTKKNSTLNHIQNIETHLSNGFAQIPADHSFTLIVSNLPAKVSKEMYWIFVNDAYQRLAPGGRLYVVVIAGLKEFVKRNFDEIFGNYEKVAHTNTHIVAMAKKL